MKYLLSGGGSGGPVTPLIAIAEELKNIDSDAQFTFVGPSKEDPSAALAESIGMKYQNITSGKLRRYFDLKNFATPFQVLRGFFESLKLLKKEKANAVISAGGFVSTPLAWAAKCKGVPVFIHQQDVRPTLTNKLIAPIATNITVTFVRSVKDFSRKKTIYTGNPIRSSIAKGNKEKAREIFNLHEKKPVLLVLGGGTGAKRINESINSNLENFLKYAQIIHVAGKGKNIFQDKHFQNEHRLDNIADLHDESAQKIETTDYHVYEFLTDEFPHALHAADVVITRAGLATLTELCSLKKASIIIPMYKTHQEDNTIPFKEKDAAVVLSEKILTPEILANEVKHLIKDEKKQKKLQENIGSVIETKNAAKKIAEIIYKKIKES